MDLDVLDELDVLENGCRLQLRAALRRRSRGGYPQNGAMCDE